MEPLSSITALPVPVLPVILLVDDDSLGVKTRTAVLECNGYRVLIASTAAEGLRVFSEQRVDLVMSDHFLRDKRGTALAEEMKRLKPDVPVMIFSGATQVPEGIEKADIFVTKLETIPVMLEEIVRLLRLNPDGQSVRSASQRHIRKAEAK